MDDERREKDRVRKPGILYSGDTRSRFTPSQSVDGARLRGGDILNKYGLDRERLSWAERNLCKDEAYLRSIEPTPHGYNEERRVNCENSLEDNSRISVANTSDRSWDKYSGCRSNQFKTHQNRNTNSPSGDGEL